MDKKNKLEQGKELASQLFDLKLTELDKMSEEQKRVWMSKFSLLSYEEFEDVRQQVIKAKISQQSQIGWQSIPHDFAVLVFCLVSTFFSLKAGLIAGIAVLVFLVSLIQVFYNQKLYQVLGYSVWLTYPAYILLGFSLFQRGLEWWKIAGIIALAWGGTFILAAIIVIPMHYFLRARAKPNPRPKK